MNKVLKKEPGFTLVEIMIVIAIIIILASFAIPNALRARVNANEAYAISVLRQISTACEGYRTAQTPPVYPGLLTELSEALPPYLTSVLTGGSVRGYQFVYSPISDIQYSCTASPITPGATGVRTFVVDESGVIMSEGIPVQ